MKNNVIKPAAVMTPKIMPTIALAGSLIAIIKRHKKIPVNKIVQRVPMLLNIESMFTKKDIAIIIAPVAPPLMIADLAPVATKP